jgi:hypothetical protein
MLRLGSLILVLCVMGMMYYRAKDPDTWRWLASDDRKEQPATSTDSPPSSVESVQAAESVIEGPNDTDADQQETFRELAQALTDNESLTAEEMFAYWQLVDWSRATPFDELWKRADKSVLFAQLFGEPADHRGELIAFNLHVKRVLQHRPSPTGEDRPTVFEAWGATDDSKTFPYCLVFADKPPQMPLGDDLTEESRFAGYFLKNMKYVDKLGKTRIAPLLIGRLRWQENPGRKAYEAARTNAPWEFWVVVGGFAAFLILRWYLRPKPTGLVTTTAGSPSEDELAGWLDAAENGPTEPEPPKPSTNGHSHE